MSGIRTFIAIDVPDTVKEQIAALQEELRAYPGRVSWTRPEGIHITLKFLGNIEPDRVDAVAEAIRRAVTGRRIPELRVVGTGAFPGWRRPRVLWVGLEDRDGVLAEIQKSVERELVAIGFPREDRPFTPHLTLARIKVPTSVAAMAAFLREKRFDAGSFRAEEVLVMRSDLKPSGAEYTPLRRVPIGQD